jgi:hypothetical protein
MMRKTLFLIVLAVTALLTFLSLPLFARGEFVGPTPSVTVTVTPETSFYPISTIAPAPTTTITVSYTPTVDRRELEQIQFIDSDTIAYRRWGNLYIHHLITQTNELIFDGNNITTFDWSSARQQFIVTKGGRLLLIDIAGKVIKNLSAVLAEQDNGFKIGSCYKRNEFIKADSNQIKGAEWSIDENWVQFAYSVIDGCYSTSLWELNPDTNILNILNTSNDFWIWLNAQTLVSSAYQGGGGRLFSIIDIPNNKTIFTVEAWGTYPVGSSDGSRLAIATHNLRKLSVFDTITGEQLVEQDFGNENRDKDSTISVINFSNTGRYVVVQGIMGLESKNSEPKYMTVIVDIETGTLWPLPAHSQPSSSSIVWLPDRDQALMFEQEKNITCLSQLSPKTQQIMPMGTITDTLGVPLAWPGDGRYLPLTDRKIYNPADYTTNWGDTNAGIWFWDRQKGNMPYPVYLITPATQGDDNFKGDAAVFAPILSPDETWLIFGQQVNWTSISSYINDTTLQSIHLPSGIHHQVTAWSLQGAQ